MRKYKCFFSFEKEEAWLQNMARGGYVLSDYRSGRYTFARTEPQNRNIRIDFRMFKQSSDYADYISLFEDYGWEHIAGSKSSGVQYFMQITDSAETEIFSDQASKAERYKRVAAMWQSLTISYLPILMVFYLVDLFNLSALTDPKSLYQTPGLWEKTGTSFWFSFLFETPFALARGFAWLCIPIFFLASAYFYWRAQRLYKNTMA